MICPRCGSERIGRNGIKHGKPNFYCKDCNRQFAKSGLAKWLPDKPMEFSTDRNGPILAKIGERYTPEELATIANGGGLDTRARDCPVIDFTGDTVRFGFFTDSHFGATCFNDNLWISFLAECKRRDVQKILCAGDIHEGMSNRPDQIYQLEDVGFSAQMDHAERLFKMTDLPIYAIDGNHDRWGIKSGGLYMVRDLAKRVPNLHFLGHDVGDLTVNGTIWRLWHGEDGNSYATSYRIQQVINSITGGDKPAVLLLGHTHKQAYIFERNIHAVSGGALSYQSDWMRSKRIPCHTGFHILEAVIKNNQIVQFSPTFYPFYN